MRVPTACVPGYAAPRTRASATIPSILDTCQRRALLGFARVAWTPGSASDSFGSPRVTARPAARPKVASEARPRARRAVGKLLEPRALTATIDAGRRGVSRAVGKLRAVRGPLLAKTPLAVSPPASCLAPGCRERVAGGRVALACALTVGAVAPQRRRPSTRQDVEIHI